jgi:rod shape determining protein RodA
VGTIRNFDWLLLAAVLLLCLLGIAFIWSVTHWTTAETAMRQAQWVGIGLVALLAVISFDYPRLADLAWPAYALTIVLLLLVPVIGVERNYAKRWIELPGANLQPSEFAKITVILILARYLMYRKNIRRLRGLIVPMLLAGLPMVLILTEPDLGTSLLILPALFAMLWVAGARPAHLMGFIGAGCAAAPLLWFFAMGRAQRGRILAFINPRADPFGAGWHIRQSMAAVASGDVTGQGFSSGAPVLLNRGFAAHTDFIFAVIAHEWGFIGGLVVLLLLFLFFTRAVDIAGATREPFGRLVTVGIVALLGFQTIVNLGMTVRLCPITGLTLPFVSYGGSSLLSCFIMAGILLNIGMRRKTVLAPEGF